jgi:hypothetical protein
MDYILYIQHHLRVALYRVAILHLRNRYVDTIRVEDLFDAPITLLELGLGCIYVTYLISFARFVGVRTFFEQCVRKSAFIVMNYTRDTYPVKEGLGSNVYRTNGVTCIIRIANKVQDFIAAAFPLITAIESTTIGVRNESKGNQRGMDNEPKPNSGVHTQTGCICGRHESIKVVILVTPPVHADIACSKLCTHARKILCECSSVLARLRPGQ